MVGNELHHVHDGHCELHGPVLLMDDSKGDYMAPLSADIDFAAPSVALRRDKAVPPFEPIPKWYRDKDSLRFIVMCFLTGSYFFIELIWGITSGSLALVADAIHMLSDLVALFVGFYAIRESRQGRSDQATFGGSRMEVVASHMNGCFLLALCFSIVVECIGRFISPDESVAGNAIEILTVACVGLGINVLGLFVFSCGGGGHGHSHAHDGDEHKEDGNAASNDEGRNLNIRGVFLHVLGDAAGSVAVIISALVMEYSTSPQRALADPICSLVITLLILASTVPLVRTTTAILLQRTPGSLSLETLQRDLLAIPGVMEIHDLHVWELTPSKRVATMHVTVMSDADFMKISHTMKLTLHTHGVHATTIQPEFISRREDMARAEQCHEPICSKDCETKYCCSSSPKPKTR